MHVVLLTTASRRLVHAVLLTTASRRLVHAVLLTTVCVLSLLVRIHVYLVHTQEGWSRIRQKLMRALH